ncbi:MAG: hypothetical protein MR294_06715 [Bacteroidales bacterium]|nr:hypothetical protein [Bacteroidales bacterium]MDD7088885.1 hypothetical protein [Bacteroidales bacterium]MDY2936527.1 hypothetical protein [Candidatus Cryptobacteroides sp.]
MTGGGGTGGDTPLSILNSIQNLLFAGIDSVSSPDRQEKKPGMTEKGKDDKRARPG